MQILRKAVDRSFFDSSWVHLGPQGSALLLGIGFLAALWHSVAVADLAAPPYQQNTSSNGLVSIELEHPHQNLAGGEHRWISTSPSGASGTGAMLASPNSRVNVNSGYVGTSPRLDFTVNFVKTGVHYVWIRGLGANTGDDSLHVGLNGAAVSTAERIAYFKNAWTWSRDTMDGAVAQIRVPSAGVHTVNVWMREDGMVADKLLLTTNVSYRPQGAGPAESTGQVKAPTVSPKGGEYEGSVTVNLSAGTEGAKIYYTLDGSRPTTSSALYEGTLTLWETATVKAIAAVTGSSASTVSTATYSVTPRAEASEYRQASGSDGLVSIELENAHRNTPANDHRWSVVSPSGGSGTGAMLAAPNTGVNVNSGYVGNSPRLDFTVNFVKTGVHYVWIRGLGANGGDDSLHVGLNGAAVSTADRIAYFKNVWTWSRNTMDGAVAQIRVPSVGVHTVNVWMREDGMVADKLVLTTNANYTPKNTGPAENSAGTAKFQQDAGGSGMVSIELENAHHNAPTDGHGWRRASPSGASGASAMEASPNTGATVNSGYVDTSPRLDYTVNFVKTGVHYVWIRGLGATGRDDSLHVGLDGEAVPTADRIAHFKNIWAWSRDTMDGVVAQIRVPSVGVHTVNVWMREDGMVADKLLLTTDADYQPTGFGPTQSTTDTTSTTTPDSFPVARPDAITVESGRRITINVMANDDGLSDGPIKVSIQQAPSSGTASATATGEIQYQAETGFTGETRLTYRLTDADGDIAVGSVAIDVHCNPCSNPTILGVSWQANPKVVDGYRVYYGPTAETAVLKLSDLNILRGDINVSSPAVEYDAEKDLGLSEGQQGCFRVQAYRASVVTGYPSEGCATWAQISGGAYVLRLNAADSVQTPPKLTGIRPYETNNSYWEYRGKPILLIGGFSENSQPFLSRKSDLVKELNAIQANGGNYIRNTMVTFQKTRVQGVFPFVKLSNGKFDLNKINSAYYDYLRVFLEETHKRQIFVQLELWDPWYYRASHWAEGPWAPKNNVNYTSRATGIPDTFEGAPYKEVNKFYYSIKDSNKAIVLKYQKDFVGKILEVAKSFDHVIYQIENEEMKNVQPLSNDWAGYWAQFIRDNAGRESYVTHMPGDYNLLSSGKQEYTLKAVDKRGKLLFGFLDISQGGMGLSNQKRFEMIRDFVQRVRTGPKNRPVNSVKIYKWRSSTSKESNEGIAISRMWHNVFAGVAAVRFHRPGAGIDKSSVALRQTMSMRYFADRVDFTKMKPDTGLLSNRSADEAYAMSPTSGKVHAVYFTGLSDRKVSISLKSVSGDLRISWYDTMSGKSRTGGTIPGGGTRILSAPSNSRWLAILE